MFDFFRRRTATELVQEAKNTYLVNPYYPHRVDYKDTQPMSVKEKESKEYYRVGRTDDGMTTLTMIGDSGMTMTLTMNQSACKQMIRMLESTFDLEQPTEETQE